MLTGVETQGLQKWTTNEHFVHALFDYEPVATSETKRPCDQVQIDSQLSLLSYLAAQDGALECECHPYRGFERADRYKDA
jgi:hypothetical protein